ncbi:DUF6522 family protein [Hoeflea sp. YIM 152468]|uniref:DUF6522 family protein n=1 Tax=Hoeflea sp. YIM 152468 TaxID=3031759 RepID=UPI0023DC4D38|nr:DUF6522 family protein [Hoeflea sp. YIM 152468]MDF1609320.1 DUF6522 family protein [Hoeflea sp. YIM 152468]
MKIEFEDGGIVIDAAIVGPLLNVAPAEVPRLMREGAITSLSEAGIDEHAGEHRLSFFYQGRRLRLQVAASGEIRARSIVDFGDMPLPRAMHRPGA